MSCRRVGTRQAWGPSAAGCECVLASPRCAELQLEEWVALVARAVGATRKRGDAHYRYDLSHSPPKGRLPLQLHLRLVDPPQHLRSVASAFSHPLEKNTTGRHTSRKEISQRSCDGISRPEVSFVEYTRDAVLPHELSDALATPMSIADAETHFWRLVSTDSCEALHGGIMRLLARLSSHAAFAGFPQACDGRGVRLRDVGLQTARRVRSFSRLHKVEAAAPLAAATLQELSASLDSRGAVGSSTGHDAEGSLHQLLWLQAIDGGESVCDLTGPQYSIGEELATTGTPFWSAPLICDKRGGPGRRLHRAFGFELIGDPVSTKATYAPLPSMEVDRGNQVVARWVEQSVLNLFSKVAREERHHGAIVSVAQ